MSQSCTKRCFTSREDARNMLRGLSRHPGSQGFRARIYFCVICRAFHMTNHEKSNSTTTGRSTKKQKEHRQKRKRTRRQTREKLRNWTPN